MPGYRSGLVSVVLINFRGAPDTIEAIAHLDSLDWPSDRLEILVVENGSGDDSARRIRESAPHVRLIESAVNHGFAGGCNLAVASARGEYIAFLNNDARPDAQWVAATIDVFEGDDRVGAVASRVLDWDGKRVDYIDAALTWYGMGYKPFTGERIPREADAQHDVLFGTGAAMFVRRTVYEQLGGFDDRFFMFFEDVDFGWRMNLRGWRFRYQPTSLAFHKHHASMSAFGDHKERFLLERNALFALYKNLDDESLARVLPAALLLAVRRGVVLGGEDSASFDLRVGGDDAPQMTISTAAVAPLFAMDAFVDQLDGLRRDREIVQSTRVRTDAAMWRLFGLADNPIFHEKSFLDGYEKIVASFDVASGPARGNRVLIITGDPIGPKLAGPAIRAWNMAQQLSPGNEVRLMTLSGLVGAVDAPFEIVHVAPGDERRFAAQESWADMIVFQGHAMAVFDGLRRSDKVLVVDIYDPMHLEQLEQGRELGDPQWTKQVADATEILNEQLARGDFFLCASERQRHFYLGQLAALGRITPATYRGDPDLRGLIDTVPFGLPSEAITHDRDVLKGILPGIGVDDKVVIWGGGLYNWFDPLSLIRAVAALSSTRPNIRLFFQGTQHPHPGVPEMRIVADSRQLAADLGVANRHVFFNDSWVDYADRHNYLTEADAGVSTHHAHVETTFSFRTRILDYLWAGLPMVVTAGDHFADLIERERLGVVVPADDVDGLADALERVLFDEKFAAEARRNIERVRSDYTWEAVLEPLRRFTLQPRPAADRPQAGQPARRTIAAPRRRSGIRHDARLALYYLRTAGPLTVLGKVRRRLRRR